MNVWSIALQRLCSMSGFSCLAKRLSDDKKGKQERQTSSKESSLTLVLRATGERKISPSPWPADYNFQHSVTSLSTRYVLEKILSGADVFPPPPPPPHNTKKKKKKKKKLAAKHLLLALVDRNDCRDIGGILGRTLKLFPRHPDWLLR